MKVLIVGGGGREHALAWKLAQSSRLDALVFAPGNAGMAQLGTCFEGPLDPQSLLDLARRESIDLTVIGPEAPLVDGVVDLFERHGLAVFGPSEAAARLEGSKRYAKEFMARHRIPTAAHRSFTDLTEALSYLREASVPFVVKDSALAAGKGVTVTESLPEAEAAVRAILDKPGGGEVVVESFLSGQEVSLLLFTDGERCRPMVLAQDYKQALDGDTGPMTGGMGTVAPVSLLSEAQYAEVLKSVVEPTLGGLRAEGMRYRGVLFIGLMVGAEGIKVLEYNVRFGDPETQVVMRLLKTDLLDIIESVIEGRLADCRIDWSEAHAACIVMASPGYPGAYRKDIPISIPELSDEVVVFHAGTRLDGGRLLSSGGRVLGVSAVAADRKQALESAYRAVEAIAFEQAHYRRDIGLRLPEA